ncbi:hypothetical protein NSPZN2_100408 [Nitrospira defluvii]|uniref:Transposase n=1 Tax=Nitrospira defluvii TaxID=330214 RepID=A0ABN7L758_9BACT|nr:hypothetical protein NSPZN2_100408 [Nitrospira defluvii]
MTAADLGKSNKAHLHRVAMRVQAVNDFLLERAAGCHDDVHAFHLREAHALPASRGRPGSTHCNVRGGRLVCSTLTVS